MNAGEAFSGYLLILHRIICKFNCKTKKEQKLRQRQWKNCTRIEFMFIFLIVTYITRFLPHIPASSFLDWVLFVFKADVVFVTKPHLLFSARKLFSKSNVCLKTEIRNSCGRRPPTLCPFPSFQIWLFPFKIWHFVVSLRVFPIIIIPYPKLCHDNSRSQAH